MALGKGAAAIHQSGMLYILMERHMAKEARRSSKKNNLKGPRKRTS